MNCQTFAEIGLDIARGQIIEAGARAEALSHCDTCEDCAASLQDQLALTHGLRELAHVSSSLVVPARIETNLLAAFEKQTAIQFPAPLAPQQAHRSAYLRAPYLISAIAALLLLVFGLSLIRWRSTVPVNQNIEAPLVADVAPPKPITKATVAPIDRPIFAKSGNSVNRKAPSHKIRVAKKPEPVNAARTEIATDFLPLTYGAATNLAEGGRMVRIELPHSALSAFGLPVNADRANERVKADVLLGVDGLAQAIRFIR